MIFPDLPVTLAAAAGVLFGLQLFTGQPLRFIASLVHALQAGVLWLEYTVRDAARGSRARWLRCWREVRFER